MDINNINFNMLQFIIYIWIVLYSHSCRCSVSAAVFPNSAIEDKEFWELTAEKQLHRVLTLSDAENLSLSKLLAKNIILFIGDGMGMSTITASRIYKGQLEGRSGEEELLEFDEFPNVGLAKTYNVDKQVPDSAGTATALFTGVKTNYGVVGMDIIEANSSQSESVTPKLTSIIDWAISAKKKTGFVTTTRVTHATPAALYAHSASRDWECDTLLPEDKRNSVKDIARQLIENSPGSEINVILGGGRQMFGVQTDEQKFYGSSEIACQRLDKRNLIDDWLNGTFAKNKLQKRFYAQNQEDLIKARTENVDYLLGLFADNHMAFNSISKKYDDGLSSAPTLPEMVEAAIDLLEHGENGFLLVVEGGRIDQAHHQNHARLALEEVVEFDKAISNALRNTENKDTLIIVTADHSHAMTLNGYPKRGNDILGFANKPNVSPYETLTYANGPGYWTHRTNDTDGNTWIRVETLDENERRADTYRHQAMLPIPDETHGGEDVPVYAHGPGAQLVRGVFEQNYIAYIVSYAGCMGPAQIFNLKCPKANLATNEKQRALPSDRRTHKSSALSINLYNFKLYLICLLMCLYKYNLFK